MMNHFPLYSRVAICEDLPAYGLRSGDIAVILEFHESSQGENGYTLEVFNAVGETIAVPTVKESQVQPLHRDEILHIRPYHAAVVAESGKKYEHG